MERLIIGLVVLKETISISMTLRALDSPRNFQMIWKPYSPKTQHRRRMHFLKELGVDRFTRQEITRISKNPKTRKVGPTLTLWT